MALPVSKAVIPRVVWAVLQSVWGESVPPVLGVKVEKRITSSPEVTFGEVGL